MADLNQNDVSTHAEPLGPRDSVLRARLSLGVFVLLTTACLVVAFSADPNPPFVPPPGATSDLDFYKQVVNRVSHGDSFYDAAHDELLKHGYPTASVFNWRTPTYAWLLGRGLGMELGRWVLMFGVVTVVVMTCRDQLQECGIVPASIGAVMLVGATAWCFGGETFLFMELWAGMLIALSLCAYHRGWTWLSVSAGIFAVFYRELALPYVVLCLGIALWQGRRREALAWTLGLALFAAFMAYHAQEVSIRLTSADKPLVGGWVRFGGLRFILLTARTNVFLMPLADVYTAIFLPLSMLGLAGMARRGEANLRIALTAGVFLAAFAIVGNPFNFYWGFINAPLLAMGIAFVPSTLLGMIREAFPAHASTSIRWRDAHAGA